MYEKEDFQCHRSSCESNNENKEMTYKAMYFRSETEEGEMSRGK